MPHRAHGRAKASTSLICSILSISLLLLTAGTASAAKRWGSFAIEEGGEPFTQPLPTSVGLEGVSQIDASNASSYFLKEGAVYALGDNESGELGNGTVESSSTPVKVHFPPGVTITAIGEAENKAYAIDSTGQGWAWGGASHGTLCLGDEVKQTTPVKVPGITSAKAVQGGELHVLWLLDDGRVEACGTNDLGQLGVGKAVRQSEVPVFVPGLTGVAEITAGVTASGARTASGDVFEWGGGHDGEIGTGGKRNVFTPFDVPLPGPATDFSVGGYLNNDGFSLALVHGQMYGWGFDQENQLGDDGDEDRLSPVASGLRFSQVVASGNYTLGLDSEGDVFAFGAGLGDGLGTGNEENELTPTIVDTGAHEISATAHDSLDR
jgi:alpha-tubulin suppressor-like RCC1 family protein